MTPYGSYAPPQYVPPSRTPAPTPQMGPGRTPIAPGMSIPNAPQYTPPPGTGYDGSASQDWRPRPGTGLTPDKLHPNGFPDYVLRDSNPVRYPKPVVTGQPRPTSTTDTRAGFPQMTAGQPAAGGGLGGGGGYILGSSVGPPAGYGAGLAPASGLGGGLYPSLVGLYR